MRKYKCNPPKPGWYLAWFNGTELNFPDCGELYERNAFYWTGEVWEDYRGMSSNFFHYVYKDVDRWSYLPKDHPKKEKKPSRNKVAPQGLYI